MKLKKLLVIALAALMMVSLASCHREKLITGTSTESTTRSAWLDETLPNESTTQESAHTLPMVTVG